MKYLFFIVAFHESMNSTNSNKDSYTFGKLGQTSLGDLITIINSYDETAGYTSNSLSAYFHELADSRKLNSLVQSEWLGIGTWFIFDHWMTVMSHYL